jgi:hypothetical protein
MVHGMMIEKLAEIVRKENRRLKLTVCPCYSYTEVVMRMLIMRVADNQQEPLNMRLIMDSKGYIRVHNRGVNREQPNNTGLYPR